MHQNIECRLNADSNYVIVPPILKKLNALDHHLTTPSFRPVPCIVFHVSTFFYGYQNQRRKLCTPHNFRRCIIEFCRLSRFSDPEGQRFESSRSHQEQHLMGCCSFCFAWILWSSKRADSNSPCPAAWRIPSGAPENIIAMYFLQ